MRKMMTALVLAGGLAVSTISLASAASVPMVTSVIAPTVAAPTPLVHVQYYGGGYREGPRQRYWRHERWRRHMRHDHWHDGRGYR
ncbi:MAG: hypothetical protein ACRYGI_17050 [Janthinobacterium lividum]